MWQVIILEIETMQTFEAFTPVSNLETAERIQREVERNLNRNKYMTDLVYLGEDLMLW